MDATELKAMFPKREVVILDTVPVQVTPLSLEDLPKVADAFSRLMKLADQGVGQAEIAGRGLVELLQLLPYCIDIPPSHIPSTDAPDILEAVIELNLTESVVGKWRSLIQKLLDKVEEVKAEAEEEKPPPSQD